MAIDLIARALAIKAGKIDIVPGDLPAPRKDGSVLVSENGKWEQQDGYAYFKHTLPMVSWDGSKTEREKATFVPSEAGSNAEYYLVSSRVYNQADVVNWTVGFSDDGIIDEETMYEEDIETIDSDVFSYEDKIFVCAVDGKTINTDIGELTFPKKGVYFLFDTVDDVVSFVAYMEGPKSLQPFDLKYIPSVVISSSSDIVINGQNVPELSVSNVQKAYNTIVAGYQCVISNKDGNMHFTVNQAESVDGGFSISFMYKHIMFLNYTSDGSTVTVTYTPVLNLSELTAAELAEVIAEVTKYS